MATGQLFQDNNVPKVTDNFGVHGILNSFLDILTGKQFMYNESISKLCMEKLSTEDGEGQFKITWNLVMFFIL